MLASLVKSVCSSFNKNEYADQVQAFFEAHPVPAADRAIRQSIEQVIYLLLPPL